MKKLLLFFVSLLIFCSGMVFAQKQKVKSNYFKQPKGFAYIPADLPNGFDYAFYCLAEPVKKKDYLLFLNELKANGDSMRWRECYRAMETNTSQQKYVILNNPSVIPFYANYVLQKLSKQYPDEVFNVRPITMHEWDQIKGPQQAQAKMDTKNKLGLRFFKVVGEIRVSFIPVEEMLGTPSYNYELPQEGKGGFRLVMSHVSH